MFSDRYGLPLSTRSQTAADLFVDGVDRILSFDVDGLETVEGTIAADDGFAMPHAVKALQLQQQGDNTGAVTSAQTAMKLASGVSARERSFAATVGIVVPGASPDAQIKPMEAMTAHLTEFPLDYVIFQQRSLATNTNGEKDRKQQILSRFRDAEPAYGDDWAFNGHYAMWLQENDLFGEAIAKAGLSLREKPNNANAIHPIAHLYFETNSHLEGQRVLGDWLENYEWRAPYHCHLSWHQALFALAMGHYMEVLQIWERDIAPAKVGTTRLLDMASLLWRLKLYQCWDGDLDWERMRTLVEGALTRPAATFPYSHAAIFCAAVGDKRALDGVVSSLDGLAQRGHPAAGGVIKAFVLGLGAFSDGDFAAAADAMEPHCNDLKLIGGSNAQAEVYVETFIEACLRAGKYEWAEQAIGARLSRRSSARDALWLSRALVGQSRQDEAQEAAKGAQALWPTAEPDSPEQRLAAVLAD